MIDIVRINGEYEIDDAMLYVIPWTNIYAIHGGGDNGYFGERFVYREKGETVSLEYVAETKKVYIET